MKTALITGISVQDSSYFAEQLLRLGYKVQGVVRCEPETRRRGTRKWQLTNIEGTHAYTGVEPSDPASSLLVPPEGLTMLVEAEDPRR